MAPLIFADQFLQIATLLPSRFLYGLGEHRGTLLHSLDWSTLTLWARDVAPTVPSPPSPRGCGEQRWGYYSPVHWTSPGKTWQGGGQEHWERQGVVEANGQICAGEDFRAIAKFSWHSEGPGCFPPHPAARATGCSKAEGFPLAQPSSVAAPELRGRSSLPWPSVPAMKVSSLLFLSSTGDGRCLVRWWQQMQLRTIYSPPVTRGSRALPGSCSLTRHLLFAGIIQPLWSSPLLPADGGGRRCSWRFPSQQQRNG